MAAVLAFATVFASLVSANPIPAPEPEAFPADVERAPPGPRDNIVKILNDLADGVRQVKFALEYIQRSGKKVRSNVVRPHLEKLIDLLSDAWRRLNIIAHFDIQLILLGFTSLNGCGLQWNGILLDVVACLQIVKLITIDYFNLRPFIVRIDHLLHDLLALLTRIAHGLGPIVKNLGHGHVTVIISVGLTIIVTLI